MVPVEQGACGHCGHVGRVERKWTSTVRIAFWVLLVAGLFTVGIGLIAALVLGVAAQKHPTCMRCSSTDNVPINSPRGMKLAEAAKAAKAEAPANASQFLCVQCGTPQPGGPRCVACGHAVVAHKDSEIGARAAARFGL